MTSQVETVAAKLQGYKQDLGNSGVQGRQRLQAIEGMADHITLRRIEGLGIKEGWRCFEVGCGSGSIARWMSYRVAPHGHVLAVDTNTQYVADAASAILEVRQQDITTMRPPEKTFDLVHSRMVLQHLAERETLVEQLIASLKPGGWLLLEEMETFSLFQNDTGPFLQVVEIMHAMGRGRCRAPSSGWGCRTSTPRARCSTSPGAPPPPSSTGSPGSSTGRTRRRCGCSPASSSSSTPSA